MVTAARELAADVPPHTQKPAPILLEPASDLQCWLPHLDSNQKPAG